MTDYYQPWLKDTDVLEAVETRCHYRMLANGVHEFVMYEFSRSGVDAFVEQVGQMNAAAAPNVHRAILVDSGGGVQPLGYLFSRLRSMADTTPGQSSSHVAVLMQPGVMVGMIGGMMRVFPFITVRFFRPDQREAAMQWLLEGRG